MYGILKPAGCSLKKSDTYKRYKLYYCGLCHNLGSYYTNLGRLTVNYDMTFIYLLLAGLDNKENILEDVFCPTLPWKKRPAIINEYIKDFIAAANIYLAGLKIKDDLHDEGSQFKRISFKFIAKKHQDARRRLHKLGVDMEKVDAIFEEQFKNERDGKTLEEYYLSTSRGLGMLLKEGGRILKQSKETTDILEKIGKNLGKIIYIMDSFVDYPADIKNNQFNAIIAAFGDKIQLKNNIPPSVRKRLEKELSSSIGKIKKSLKEVTFGEEDLIYYLINNLETRIEQLIINTREMENVEQIMKSGSPLYILKHPSTFFKSKAAYRRRRSTGCCDGDDLCTMLICCDAADCDCDSLECCMQGDPCELLECFC